MCKEMKLWDNGKSFALNDLLSPLRGCFENLAVGKFFFVGVVGGFSFKGVMNVYSHNKGRG